MIFRRAVAGLLFAAACSAQVVIPSTRYPAITGYLQLSTDQLSRLVTNVFRTLLDRPVSRVEELNEEITTETRQPQPDAAAIGIRYAQIETLCREDASTRRGIVPGQMRLLTEPQRALVQELEGVPRLLALIPSAESVYLTPRRSNRWFVFPPSTPVNDVPADLAVYLALTGPQIEEFRQALRSHHSFVASRQARTEDVRREIEQEFTQPAPSSAELGARYFELEAQRRQIEERETGLRREVRAMLDAAQRARLGAFERSNELLGVAFEAEQLAVIAARRNPASASPQAGSIRRVCTGIFHPFPVF